ncbi:MULTISPECIES: TetR/AcrR family transcriptional regulator [Atopobiaceae]|uniref:Transcriptional regulator, TetR family n=1 Tax=Parafannyhessea umbonata TaxID=604330 RepID=A0A1H6IYC1_9ACTN|nr:MULTISPECIES: TetR/AcrR family transcriptional regulator [Atopobiaceae]SEH54579.1 transcriptional regulator, TetR family [Parafannyhessea umbonata]SJZ45822.1 transcriptional regulator, TetR family [Olsenella sp. KH1P3]
MTDRKGAASGFAPGALDGANWSRPLAGEGCLADLAPTGRLRLGQFDLHVVECAAELFLREGIASVKMIDIADAAQVGVATLYRHFSTKTALAVGAATLMWSYFNDRISSLVESAEFLDMSGAQRLERLLGEYAASYVQNSSFVSFLDEFDHLVLSEGLQADDLEAYGAQIDSFYLMFDDAYLLGRQDGSVVREVDFRTFYTSVAHALIGVAQKLSRGEVISSDRFANGTKELEYIIDMAVSYLSQGTT